MKLSEFLRFKILRYPPDMKTAWILNAMKKSDDPEEVSNFKTVDGNYVRTTYGNLFNAAREHVTLDNHGIIRLNTRNTGGSNQKKA